MCVWMNCSPYGLKSGMNVIGYRKKWLESSRKEWWRDNNDYLSSLILLVLKLTVTFWEKGRGVSVHANQDFWVFVTAELRTFWGKNYWRNSKGTSINRTAKHLGWELVLVYTILAQQPASLGLLHAGIIFNILYQKRSSRERNKQLSSSTRILWLPKIFGNTEKWAGYVAAFAAEVLAGSIS